MPDREIVNAEFETLSLRLHAEGWSDRVTVERLIVEWKHLSSNVGSYPLTIDEYTNDLTARDAIELVLGWATDAVRSGIGDSIKEADAAFRAATFYDGGIAVGTFFRVDAESGWWWRRRPTSGELGAYLDRVL